MKSILIAVMATMFCVSANAQTTDSFAVVFKKIFDLASVNQVQQLKGTLVKAQTSKHDFSIYSSTLNFPGMPAGQVFDVSNDGQFQFSSRQTYPDPATVKAVAKDAKAKIQAYFKKNKIKVDFNDNGDEYPIWWQYGKGKVSIQYFVIESSKTYSFKIEISNEHF